MEPNAFPQLQLWCPRPFGTYSQNKPRAGPSAARKPLCRPGEAAPGPAGGTLSENTPPEPTDAAPAPAAASPAAPAAPAAAAAAEEGRVLLDTWYVIKPGNTKEKVAFFVAHQCGAGFGAAAAAAAARAGTMKVKGNWGSGSSKAKRRRRCHDPAKGRGRGAGGAGGGGGGVAVTSPHPNDVTGGVVTADPPDLVSVAEMVALVEQRAALALQSFPRPCGAAAAPVVFVDAGGDAKAPSGSDCSRVAEAVAHFESRHRDGGGGGGAARHNGLCRASGECSGTTTPPPPPPPPPPSPPAPPPPASSPPAGPGEVRIAFRISSGRDAAAGDAAAATATATRPSCVFMSCGAAGGTTKDQITCDLYQLISPSRDALPNNVELLLAAAAAAAAAAATPKGDAVAAADVDMGCGDTAATARAQAGEGSSEGMVSAASSSSSSSSSSAVTEEAPPAPARDCVSGFHVDVVVTGVVDQCVFFGKDSAKKMTEETVTLPLPPQEDPPPPGQLFLLPGAEETPARPSAAPGRPPGLGVEDTGGGSGAAAVDPALCRLYRHVSHEFLEIRFKIQRLLEPRQYLLVLPEHLMVKIFSYLPTRALAALKCCCRHFKSIIETFGVRAADSRWNRHPRYRDDPCKQCRKRYQRGDVSLCRWHPKPYHHDLPYGRSYWMCCRRGDRQAPGCRLGLHDNNWVGGGGGGGGGTAGASAAGRREEGR